MGTMFSIFNDKLDVKTRKMKELRKNLCPAFGKIMGGQRALSGFAAFYCLQLTKTSNAKVAYFEVAYPDPLHMIKTAERIQFLCCFIPP